MKINTKLTIRKPYTACLLNCMFPAARQCVDVSAYDILLLLVLNLRENEEKKT